MILFILRIESRPKIKNNPNTRKAFRLNNVWRRVRGDCVKKVASGKFLAQSGSNIVAVRVDRPNPLWVESRPKIKK